MRVKTKHFLILVLIFQLGSACSPTASSLQGEGWVIFPAEHAEEQKLGSWLATGDGEIEYWTPSESDVLALEAGRAAYLQDHADRFYEGVPVWERLNEYNRQYIGIILGEKKIIYANYFCDSIETDWRKDFVFVLDGGDCFFQFKYDVDTAEFFDLQVNGVA
jgi:hypothetical protein